VRKEKRDGQADTDRADRNDGLLKKTHFSLKSEESEEEGRRKP